MFGYTLGIVRHDVTQILSDIEAGDPMASEALLPLVYDELRKLAHARLARERPGQTLQATALVHEAYLRLVGNEQPRWNSRGHFFAAAAEAMRRILIERARMKLSAKHGGGRDVLSFDDQLTAVEAESKNLLVLDATLARLEKNDPEKAMLVKLRYFAGLSEEQAAEALGISRATASRRWTYARAWLYDELLRLQGDSC